jgi:hypothetical protein
MGEAIAEPTTLPRRRGCFGWPGLIAALVGITLAACGPWLAEILDPPPPPIEEQAAEVASRIKDRVIAKLRSQKIAPAAPKTEPFRWSRWLPGIAIACGVIGLTLGVLGLVRREDARLVSSAIAIGAGAVVFQWAIIIAGMLLFFLVLGLVLSAFQGTT